MDPAVQEVALSALIGGAATVLAALSLLPQAIHTWRTRSAAEISAAWLLIALASMVLWVVYGFLLDAWAVAVSNGITLVLALLILLMKLRFGRKPAPLR